MAANLFVRNQLLKTHDSMLLVLMTLTGCILGRLGAGWAAAMLFDMNSGGLIQCPGCNTAVTRGQQWFSLRPLQCQCGDVKPIRWHLASAMALGLIFCGFTYLLLSIGCQNVHEVRPATPLLYARLPFHLSLIFLLWVATLTDLLDYVIPDEIIYAGILIGVTGAFATGDLQMIHIWVNWDDVIEGVQGPYLPEWIKHHQHLHGLAWSFAGMTAGATLTWLVRFISHLILGYPALGFGDVTLMAMIGCYIGWQPTLCVLAIAPLTGVLIGLVVRLVTGKGFVAFGPYLACSALIVISTWRWLWVDLLKLRDIFSHWPSVAGLIGFAFATLTVLLIMLRVFRALPTGNLKR